MNPQALALEVEKRHRELESKRPAYEKAKASLEDLTRLVLPGLLAAIFRYGIGDPPEKAIFILAQCQQVSGDVWDAIQMVQRFEAHEKALKALQGQTPVG